MSVRAAPSAPVLGGRGSLLDIATEVLLDDPAATLATVARAAGIGRTTLHKQYATRDDLLVAVAHRALDVTEQAIAPDGDDPEAAVDGGLRRLVDELVPAGAQLSFLFRQPSLDRDAEITARLGTLDEPILAVVHRAQAAGALGRQLPDWWVVETIYALVYQAWNSIRGGRLAPLDATDVVLRTLTAGLGAAEPGRTR